MARGHRPGAWAEAGVGPRPWPTPPPTPGALPSDGGSGASSSSPGLQASIHGCLVGDLVIRGLRPSAAINSYHSGIIGRLSPNHSGILCKRLGRSTIQELIKGLLPCTATYGQPHWPTLGLSQSLLPSTATYGQPHWPTLGLIRRQSSKLGCLVQESIRGLLRCTATYGQPHCPLCDSAGVSSAVLPPMGSPTAHSVTQPGSPPLYCHLWAAPLPTLGLSRGLLRCTATYGQPHCPLCDSAGVSSAVLPPMGSPTAHSPGSPPLYCHLWAAPLPTLGLSRGLLRCTATYGQPHCPLCDSAGVSSAVLPPMGSPTAHSGTQPGSPLLYCHLWAAPLPTL
eukprot:gene19382-26031_t